MAELRASHADALGNRAGFPAPDDLAPVPLRLDVPFVVRYLNCTSNKPLHLGHMRNIVLGEATVASLRALGAHAVGHSILEDTGRFMTEAMAALRAAEARGEPIPDPGAGSDRFIGGCYAQYRAERAARSVNPCAAALPACTDYEPQNDEADRLMHALLADEPQALALRDRVRALGTSGQHATLRQLGVTIEYCDFESAEDADIAAFVQRCEAHATLARNGEERIWHSAAGTRLRLVNKGGLYEESARLLSFNARVTATPAGAYHTIVFAGSEWRASMRLYAPFLRLLGIDIADRYAPTFYGMVTLNGKKMASSAGTGVLIDDLLEDLSCHARVRAIAAQSARNLSSDQIASALARIFLLAAPRAEMLSYSPERMIATDNPGWDIVEAWAGLPEDGYACSEACRTTLTDAVERRSFEKLVARAKEFAPAAAKRESPQLTLDFLTMARALSLKHVVALPPLADIPSFLSARAEEPESGATLSSAVAKISGAGLIRSTSPAGLISETRG